jgi:tRNA-splicing ligase RtcB
MQGTPFADLGQPVLIPGSMGTASYVLIGDAAGEKSLFSVNHGAGRVMSRTAAAGGRRGRKQKRTAEITDEEFRRSMEGVYLIAEDRRSVKEEAPAAYKDIDQVIATVREAGLARPVARLIPKAVLKG